MNAFNSLYRGNETYTHSGGRFQWIFSIRSGVLQGCPLSGALFALANDPLLTQFEHYIHNPQLGAVFACADDVGAGFKHLKHFKLLFQMFDAYRKVSGLTLKARKCFAILVGSSLTSGTVALLESWLQANVPEWINLQFCGQAKYLGIHIGLTLGGKNWEAPIANCLSC